MASKHATLSPVEVFGGVDTHKQTHAAAALDSAGRLLGTEVFPADPGGYEQLLGLVWSPSAPWAASGSRAPARTELASPGT